jgi:23S rRNA pseudouridine1911/1915/1917 synthase
MSEAGPACGRVRCAVAPAEAGQRLDRLLAARGFLPTRARIAALVRQGLVTVDGVVRKASFAVPSGALVEVVLPPPEPIGVEAEDLPLDVLYEDDLLIAVNKPAGMATHPAPGSRRGTLVAALLHHWRFGSEWPDPQRPGIVHRLDKDTTGVIVVAKTPLAMHAIARQFSRRTVEKTYEAIAMGSPSQDAGVIDLPIGRDPIARQKMQARIGQQRAARTRFTVLRRFAAGASHVRLEPETGRTHQIRVHLASIGHPVVGDRTYGGGRAPATAEEAQRRLLETFPRQALHAARLRLRHPADGRDLELAAPLAADMHELLASLAALDD